MMSEKILKSLGQIDDRYILEANPGNQATGRPAWLKRGVAAACLVMLFMIGLPVLQNQQRLIHLSDASNNVKARYVNQVPADIQPREDVLEWLSEDQLFTRWNPVIFKGNIERLRNIEINFNGKLDYRALADIKVDQVYRGNIKSGTSISVLLPGPVHGRDVWIEDTGIISQIREGQTGIFMPMEYDDQSIWSQNKATLMLKDLADYGLADGMRYVFLQTANGLVFAKDAYPSFADASNLDEIAAYISSKQDQNH